MPGYAAQVIQYRFREHATAVFCDKDQMGVGRRLVEKEQRLDELFAKEGASRSEVKALLEEIGELRVDLRFAHVQAHMQVKEILTPSQVKRYDKLKGYGDASSGQKLHSHRSHGA